MTGETKPKDSLSDFLNSFFGLGIMRLSVALALPLIILHVRGNVPNLDNLIIHHPVLSPEYYKEKNSELHQTSGTIDNELLVKTSCRNCI